jgi:hypothetical protein
MKEFPLILMEVGEKLPDPSKITHLEVLKWRLKNSGI